MDFSMISTIISIVLAVLSFGFAVLKTLQGSKNKKIAQSAQTALDTLYAVRDAMFKVEDKKYTSEDKETVALSLAKESCQESKIACSEEGLKSSVGFIMEIGNTINKRDNSKVGVVVEQNRSNNNQN